MHQPPKEVLGVYLSSSWRDTFKNYIGVVKEQYLDRLLHTPSPTPHPGVEYGFDGGLSHMW